LTNSNSQFQFASAHTQPTAVQRDVGALDESVVQMEKSSAPKPQDQLKSKLLIE
jgi:hypothetical protein